MDYIDKLNDIITNFLFKNRFYYEIIQRINRVYTENIDKIGINIKKNSIDILINPSFITKNEENILESYLEHEILHLLFYHPIRKKYVKNPKIYDIASDLTVNQYLTNLPIEFLTINKVFSGINVDRFRETEYYYFLLEEELNSGKIFLENYNIDDNHEEWDDELNKENKYNLDEFFNDINKDENLIIDRIISESYYSSHGVISSELIKGYVEKVFINKNKNIKKNWKKLLKKFIEKNLYKYSFKEFKVVLSKKRPNKKLGFPYPSLKITPKNKNNVVVIIDSSGSTTGNNFIENFRNKNSNYFRNFEFFIDELNNLSKQEIAINLVFCDENVLNPYIIENYEIYDEELNKIKDEILYLSRKINYKENGVIYDYNYKKKEILINLINNIIEYNNKNPENNIKGIGGGTSFVKSVELVEKLKPIPSCIIYLTDNKDDGKLKKPKIPIVFVSNEEPHQKYDFGEYIVI